MVTNTYDVIRTGVNQPNRGGFLYPFVSDSFPICASIVDIRVGFNPDVHVMPLTLHTCGNMVSGSKRIIVKDGNDVTVVDTQGLLPPKTVEWGDRYTVMVWPNAAYGLSIAFDTELMTDADAIAGEEVEIDVRACEPATRLVRSIKVYNADGLVLGDMKAFAKIKWMDGYNAKVTSKLPQAPTLGGNKLSSTVFLTMAPGDGLGQYDTCPELNAGLVGKLGGAVPDNTGNISLGADPCLRIEPVVSIVGDEAILEPGVVMIADDCKACCDCEDYASVYAAMNRTQRKISNASMRSQGIVSNYEDSRSFIHDRIQCTIGQTLLRIIGSAVEPNDYGLGVGLANPTALPINNVVLRLTMSQVNSNGTATKVSSTTRATYASLLRNNVAESYGQVEIVDGSLVVHIGRIPANETISAIVRLESVIQSMAQACVEVVSWEPEDTTVAMPTKICTLIKSCGV